MKRSTYSDLSAATPCSPSTEGSMAAVTDSQASTWGSTITGGGSSHVLAYCDGTHWKVVAD
jgi:CDGSH-type Zn-finger protein